MAANCHHVRYFAAIFYQKVSKNYFQEISFFSKVKVIIVLYYFILPSRPLNFSFILKMNFLRNSLINYGKRVAMVSYSKNLHTRRICSKKVKFTDEELGMWLPITIIISFLFQFDLSYFFLFHIKEQMSMPDSIELETGEAKKILMLEEMGITVSKIKMSKRVW